ncbi:ABC transporter substrate-binding protein [Rhizobiaceae bacterium BDR2-2]|uniref:ABC transporter substrate-binding protein n=1 Tax=Ectorhizobium quercum TaxID=2965071 RepID=A0AAE3N4R6_9HYPH|nr:ABC transporter substrate-binding protein [Ectorhizobium quercum]MCX8999674.1 ABC transporter substrate-binding protein [Ectorhizobium quercum]
MRFNRRQFNTLLLLATAGSILPFARSAAAAAEPVRGGTLKLLYRVDPGNALFAINTSSGTGQAIGPKIVEGLLTFDFDLTPKPLLATGWSVSDDHLRYTFRLRPNVKWHDGTPFTSEDVAFSILRLKEAHPRGRITYQNVTAVETPDPLTAVIVLSKPAPFLIAAQSSSESPIVPKHIFEKLKPGDGQTLQTAIGTGPFRLTEWTPGSHLIFDRNPDYWDAGKPYLDRIILRIITDPAARAVALETGEVDIGEGPVPLADLERLKQNPNLVVDTTTYAYAGPQQQLFFNYDNEILRQKPVRLAIAKAIDLQEIVDVALFGYAQVSPSPVSTALPKWYDPAVKAHPHDVAEAERLLDEAGYPRQADGKRFRLRLTYNAYLTPGYADVIRNQLEKIGIGVEINKYDLPTFLKTVYTDRAFDLVVESLSNTFDPSLGIQRAYWSRNFQIGLPFSNAANYSNPDADALLEAAAIEPDEKKRWELWSKFQHLIHDEVASVDLVAAGSQIVYHRKVRNHVTGAQGLNWSFGDLWIDTSAS